MAWSFDETDDDVQFTDNAALTLPDGDWTIAGWIKLDDNAGVKYQYFLSWGTVDANPNLNWMFREHNCDAGDVDKLSCSCLDADGDGGATIFIISAGTPGTSTVWQHLILQRSGDDITQYVNNVADGTVNDAAMDAVNVAGNLFLGSRSDQDADRRFGGDMAEWAKWDRALNASERAGLVKRYSPLFYPGWKWYVPMIRAYQELIVPLTVTNDGSIAAPHPPIIYPFGTRPLHFAVGAPPTGQPTMRRWGGVPGMPLTGRIGW